MKKTSHHKKLTSTFATIASLLLILLGTIGLIALQRPLREKSQDVRSDASVDGGQVLLSATPSSGELPLETVSINLSANTQGVQTDGVQLVFNIITDALGSAPTVGVLSESGLTLASSNVEQTADGYLVSMIALPQQIGQTFSTTSATTFAYLDLPLSTAGSIELSFDREQSKSIIHGTNPTQDALNHVETFTYTTGESDEDNADGDDPVACTADAKICPDGSSVGRVAPDCEFAACPADDSDDSSNDQDNADNSDDNDNTNADDNNDDDDAESSNDDSGVGGLTVSGCNESCDSNAECEANHRCYSGQCRLVTNVSSETCEEYDPGDQGLSFGCNEYCADSNECGFGYSCLENKCRRGDNPDDEYCRVPSDTILAEITANCNQDCSSNADCSMNMGCFAGMCRLATNPSSSTCSAPTAKTVSTLYANNAKGNLKGGVLDDDENNKDKTDATPAAIISTPTPSPESAAMLDDDFFPEEKTALDTLMAALNRAGVPTSMLPLLALGVGIVILLVILIPRALAAINHRRSPHLSGSLQKDQGMNSGHNPEGNQYEQELQQKINQLSEQSGPSVSAAPAPTPPNTPKTTVSTTSVAPATPVAAKSVNVPAAPTPTVAPTTQTTAPATNKLDWEKIQPQPIAARPAMPTQPTTKQTTQKPTQVKPIPTLTGATTDMNHTSMTERVKNKGIKPPQD
jgi:hypothetical protein